MSENLNSIPHSWIKTTVGELADYVNGRAFKPEEWKDTGLPIIRIQNLNDKTAKYNYSPEQHEKKYLIRNGDLLFAWSASLGAHIWHGGDAWLNQHIFHVLPQKHTTKLFVFYLLKKIIAELYAKAHGSGMVHVTKGKFESTEILLPPLNEQHRIVAKIEELFTELDAAIASLQTAQAQLKTYRQALLAHAFAGKLTAQWRADNADKVEPASVLIQRIAAERQSRYAAELAAWASGVSGNGRKPRPPQELSPLTPAELAELPALPEGWAWVKAEEISEFITKGTTPQKAELFSDGGEIPFIKVYNLTHNGSLDFSINPTFVSWNTHDSFLARSKVFPGDVLMNIVGPPLGKVSIVPSIYPEWNINQAIARFRSHFVSRKFLSNYLLFEGTIRTMMSKSKATAGQFNLTLEICREIPVPLCSQLEQSEIVKEIEARLSVVDQLEQTITDALQQAAALRQSILKKAFAGQLVPQDPNDEPAVALLARIRAAKASHDQR